MSDCVLCGASGLAFYHRDSQREYWRCSVCELVQVPPAWHLSAAAEKAHYDLHENTPGDPAYRTFLSRTFDPVVARLQPGAAGLDFGCGPGPALPAMFREAGFHCAEYDLFYAPDEEVLQRRYDFITATEVVEHLAAPGEVLNRLWQQLRPHGLLALMTKRVLDVERFAGWHYRVDPTHIVFFHQRTFEWLAGQWEASVIFPANDVVLLQKKTTISDPGSRTGTKVSSRLRVNRRIPMTGQEQTCIKAEN